MAEWTQAAALVVIAALYTVRSVAQLRVLQAIHDQLETFRQRWEAVKWPARKT